MLHPILSEATQLKHPVRFWNNELGHAAINSAVRGVRWAQQDGGRDFVNMGRLTVKGPARPIYLVFS